MNYLKTRWIHQFPDEPVLLMSELDDERYEVRKIEVFRDGRVNFADEVRSSGDAELGDKPAPPTEEIAADPGFVVLPFSAEEFEQAWTAATSGETGKF